MMRGVLAVGLLLSAAGLALAPGVGAQAGGCSAPQVSVLDTGVTFEPGASHDVAVSVSNPNDVEATASLTATPPDGWSVDGPEEVDIAAQESAEVVYTLQAPEEDGAGGPLQVEASLTCGTPPLTSESPSDTASGDLVYETPGLPWAWIVAGGAAFVAAGGGVAAYRRRPSGLEADCPQPVQEVAPGGRTSFELAVENPRDAPDTAAVGIRDPPPGWKAFATVGEVELDPAEVRNPTVAIVAPDDSAPGDSARFAVEVTSERSGESTTVPVRVDVRAGTDHPT